MSVSGRRASSPTGADCGRAAMPPRLLARLRHGSTRQVVPFLVAVP